MAEQIALALIDGKFTQISATDTIRGAGASSSSTFRCVKFYDSAQAIPAVIENLFEAEISGGTIGLNPLKEQVI